MFVRDDPFSDFTHLHGIDTGAFRKTGCQLTSNLARRSFTFVGKFWERLFGRLLQSSALAQAQHDTLDSKWLSLRALNVWTSSREKRTRMRNERHTQTSCTIVLHGLGLGTTTRSNVKTSHLIIFVTVTRGLNPALRK